MSPPAPPNRSGIGRSHQPELGHLRDELVREPRSRGRAPRRPARPARARRRAPCRGSARARARGRDPSRADRGRMVGALGVLVPRVRCRATTSAVDLDEFLRPPTAGIVAGYLGEGGDRPAGDDDPVAGHGAVDFASGSGARAAAVPRRALRPRLRRDGGDHARGDALVVASSSRCSGSSPTVAARCGSCRPASSSRRSASRRGPRAVVPARARRRRRRWHGDRRLPPRGREVRVVRERSRRASGMAYFNIGGNTGYALGPIVITPVVLGARAHRGRSSPRCRCSSSGVATLARAPVSARRSRPRRGGCCR